MTTKTTSAAATNISNKMPQTSPPSNMNGNDCTMDDLLKTATTPRQDSTAQNHNHGVASNTPSFSSLAVSPPSSSSSPSSSSPSAVVPPNQMMIMDMMQVDRKQQRIILEEMCIARQKLQEENQKLRDDLAETKLVARILKLRILQQQEHHQQAWAAAAQYFSVTSSGNSSGAKNSSSGNNNNRGRLRLSPRNVLKKLEHEIVTRQKQATINTSTSSGMFSGTNKAPCSSDLLQALDLATGQLPRENRRDFINFHETAIARLKETIDHNRRQSSACEDRSSGAFSGNDSKNANSSKKKRSILFTSSKRKQRAVLRNKAFVNPMAAGQKLFRSRPNNHGNHAPIEKDGPGTIDNKNSNDMGDIHETHPYPNNNSNEHEIEHFIAEKDSSTDSSQLISDLALASSLSKNNTLEHNREDMQQTPTSSTTQQSLQPKLTSQDDHHQLSSPEQETTEHESGEIGVATDNKQEAEIIDETAKEAQDREVNDTASESDNNSHNGLTVEQTCMAEDGGHSNTTEHEEIPMTDEMDCTPPTTNAESNKENDMECQPNSALVSGEDLLVDGHDMVTTENETDAHNNSSMCSLESSIQSSSSSPPRPSSTHCSLYAAAVESSSSSGVSRQQRIVSL